MNRTIQHEDFRSFLFNRLGVSYNSWLCTSEPYKTEIYNAYVQFCETGKYNSSICDFMKSSTKDYSQNKKFCEWLWKTSKLKLESFQALPRPLKIKIMNMYLEDTGLADKMKGGEDDEEAV